MRSLEHEGVETLFGYPGGAIMPVYDALYGYRDGTNRRLRMPHRDMHVYPVRSECVW